ncbi:hypothetical protein [Bradyrhizobium sp. BR 1432]|uniref:hypothetical protein n=1 Tax=Bradyrhizobium sp. BR 1432 TaxID=3447966 RepID=UPI003EE5B713
MWEKNEIEERRDLAAPLTGEENKLHDRAEGAADLAGRNPNGPQFVIVQHAFAALRLALLERLERIGGEGLLVDCPKNVLRYTAACFCPAMAYR